MRTMRTTIYRKYDMCYNKDNQKLMYSMLYDGDHVLKKQTNKNKTKTEALEYSMRYNPNALYQNEE